MCVTNSFGTLRYRKSGCSVLFFEGPSVKLSSKVFRNCFLTLLGTSCVPCIFYWYTISVIKSFVTWQTGGENMRSDIFPTMCFDLTHAAQLPPL